MRGLMGEEQIEKLRGKAKIRTYIVYGLTIISFLFYLWLSYELFKEDGDALWLMLLKMAAAAAVLAVGTLGALWLLIARGAYNRFRESFKTEYVLEILERIPEFQDLKYQQKNSFTWEEIRDAAVICCGDKNYFKGEDLLMGRYQGAPFRLSDVTVQRIIRRDRKNRVEELFDGQVMCFSLPAGMETGAGRLQIFQKEFFSDLRGRKAGHKIHTGNETFDKKFQVYAEDEKDGYRILSPLMQEKIQVFAAAAGGQTAITFWGERLYVAVNGRSLFDPAVDEPVAEQKKKILEDVGIIRKAGELLL